MLVKNFEYVEDYETGSLGWLLENAPKTFRVGEGIAVAHDTLEHFQDTTDSWEDELQAFGALCFTRGISGDLSTPYHRSGESAIALDIYEALRFFEGECKQREVKPLRQKGRWSCYGFDFIDNAIKIAIGMFEEYESTNVSKQTITGIRNWMRYGYRRAEKRFHKDNRIASKMFANIRDAVDKIKFAEEGDKIKVIANIKTGETKVKFIQRRWEY